MPRKKLVDDGHEINRNPRSPTFSVGSGDGGVADVSDLQAADLRRAEAWDRYIWLCSLTDGWLRIVRDKNGKVVHYKYKFTSSTWPNHYVYWLCTEEQHTRALVGLAEKVELVLDGTMKPTFDSWYGEH